MLHKRTFIATSLILILAATGCDRTVRMPRDLNAPPFLQLRDVELGAKRSDLEKSHKLRRMDNMYIEDVIGYSVYYTFVNDKLESLAVSIADPTEGASQLRYQMLVQEGFRSLGVKPVCGLNPRTNAVSARFDINRAATYVVTHRPEIVQNGQVVRPALTTRSVHRDPDAAWKRLTAQKCVR